MKIRNYMLLNESGKYQDVSENAGAGLKTVESSRAAAVEDFDNDGDLDIVVVNSGAAPTLLRNTTTNENHWVKLMLEQPGENPSSVGTRVTLTHNSKTQMREIVAGRGYQSHFGSVLHFGLGSLPGTVSLNIRWPDGTNQEINVEMDKLTRIERKSG